MPKLPKPHGKLPSIPPAVVRHRRSGTRRRPDRPLRATGSPRRTIRRNDRGRRRTPRMPPRDGRTRTPPVRCAARRRAEPWCGGAPPHPDARASSTRSGQAETLRCDRSSCSDTDRRSLRGRASRACVATSRLLLRLSPSCRRGRCSGSPSRARYRLSAGAAFPPRSSHDTVKARRRGDARAPGGAGFRVVVGGLRGRFVIAAGGRPARAGRRVLKRRSSPGPPPASRRARWVSRRWQRRRSRCPSASCPSLAI
jgi:hypothetical protein